MVFKNEGKLKTTSRQRISGKNIEVYFKESHWKTHKVGINRKHQPSYKVIKLFLQQKHAYQQLPV
jgi:hypothetical protein